MKKLTPLLVLLILIYACSKSDQTPSLTGEWEFTTQSAQSYPYPSVVQQSNVSPVSVGSRTSTDGSVHITFETNGNYTFTNSIFPVDKGTYVVAGDSLLIIKPDTAGFVKFNYTLLSVYGSTGVNNPPILYPDFIFSTDTIHFKISGGNSLTLNTAWISKAYSPLIPSNDTLLLNQNTMIFKKNH